MGSPLKWRDAEECFTGAPRRAPDDSGAATRLRSLASASDTRSLIEGAIRRFLEEVPALAALKIVAALELRARGGVQLWRVELPGPKVTKDIAPDARIRLSISRSHFNALASKGRVRDWREAFEKGDATVTGVEQVMKLIEHVVERQEERARTRKTRV